jgi:hypothetical protein
MNNSDAGKDIQGKERTTSIAYVTKDIENENRIRTVKRHFNGEPPTTFRGTIINIILLFFVIGAWRSAWNLWNLYLLPHDPYVSAWVGLILCLLVIFVMAENKLAAVV